MSSEWILGRNPVLEAIRADREIEKLYLAEGMKASSIQTLVEEVKAKRIPFQWVPRSKLDQIANGENHQGVAASVAAYHYASLEDLFARAKQNEEPAFFLILDSLQDPHNLGSILRTADAMGVHGVIIPKRRAVGLTAVVAKTSAGAIEHVPVARVSNLSQVIEELKQRGLWIIGTDGKAKDQYDIHDYTIPLALIIGSEGEGIGQLLKKKCDFLVRIPMKGKMNSLNASVAAGILMAEVMRRRSGDS